MAAHSSTRITQLYDRHEDRATLDIVPKINRLFTQYIFTQYSSPQT